MTSGWPGSWIWAIRSFSPFPLSPLPHTLSVLGLWFGPLFLQLKPVQRSSLGKAKCCWDYLDCIHDWTQVRPLYRHLRFWRAGAETGLSCSRWREALYMFPCLLNLPLTYGGWGGSRGEGMDVSASFLLLFQFSVSKGQFVNQQLCYHGDMKRRCLMTEIAFFCESDSCICQILQKWGKWGPGSWVEVWSSPASSLKPWYGVLALILVSLVWESNLWYCFSV